MGALGAETVRLDGERVSGLATGVGLVVGEEAMGEVALAQLQPDPLDRVEFGAIGRQRDKGGRALLPEPRSPRRASNTATGTLGTARGSCTTSSTRFPRTRTKRRRRRSKGS